MKSFSDNPPIEEKMGVRVKGILTLTPIFSKYPDALTLFTNEC